MYLPLYINIHMYFFFFFSLSLSRLVLLKSNKLLDFGGKLGQSGQT